MAQDDWDGVLLPHFEVRPTRRFSTIEAAPGQHDKLGAQPRGIYVDLNCEYTRSIVVAAIQRRPWCRLDAELDITSKSVPPVIQLADFENIEWEYVISGRHGAASYLIRKGLSRKAQLSLQIRRFLSKHPDSILAQAVPFTVILETWGAFEDVRMDFGAGTIASFALTCPTPLRQRLEWCLEDGRQEVTSEQRADWLWILKPSVINKGVDISVVRDWDGVLDCLEATPDIREWVCQRYIPNPLLLAGHKFHLRVYVLCVGALTVHVFDRILVLLAARGYDANDLDDIYRHLTNTARAAETDGFDEERFVKMLEDLPSFVPGASTGTVRHIKEQVHLITRDLFRAFENEYTVFAPMPQCFELYGLDFLVDDEFRVSLLEANPGPDFKQTGTRLRRVIVELWEQTCSIVLDGPHPRCPDFTTVYDCEWSSSRIQGGMRFS